MHMLLSKTATLFAVVSIQILQNGPEDVITIQCEPAAAPVVAYILDQMWWIPKAEHSDSIYFKVQLLLFYTKTSKH